VYRNQNKSRLEERPFASAQKKWTFFIFIFEEIEDRIGDPR